MVHASPPRLSVSSAARCSLQVRVLESTGAFAPSMVHAGAVTVAAGRVTAVRNRARPTWRTGARAAAPVATCAVRLATGNAYVGSSGALAVPSGLSVIGAYASGAGSIASAA